MVDSSNLEGAVSDHDDPSLATQSWSCNERNVSQLRYFDCVHRIIEAQDWGLWNESYRPDLRWRQVALRHSSLRFPPSTGRDRRISFSKAIPVSFIGDRVRRAVNSFDLLGSSG